MPPIDENNHTVQGSGLNFQAPEEHELPKTEVLSPLLEARGPSFGEGEKTLELHSTDSGPGVTRALDRVPDLFKEGKCKEMLQFLVERYLGQEADPETIEAAETLLNVDDEFYRAIHMAVARREGLTIPLDEREFYAVGQAIAALGMANHDKELCSRVAAFLTGDDRNYRELERGISEFATNVLFAKDSPVAFLLLGEAYETNNRFERALLKGSLQTLFAVYDERTDNIFERVIKFFRDRFNNHEPRYDSLKDKGDLSYRESILFEKLYGVARDGVEHRSDLWDSHTEECSKREEEQRRLALRREKLLKPGAVSAELDSILRYPIDEQVIAIADLLYMVPSITQDDAIRILRALPKGTHEGRNGGYDKMRKEISIRGLGNFDNPAFEPIDRLIIWLTLHRIEEVTDASAFRAEVEAVIPYALDKSITWSGHDPKYKTALRRLFADLLEEVTSPTGIERSVNVVPSADMNQTN